MTGVESLALLCLTLNVYKEARGEPVAGQMAVALVTLNRTKRTGDVCQTVFERGQFSWVATDTVNGVLLPHKRPDRTSIEWKRAEAAATAAVMSISRNDFTRGATHFYSGEIKPTWTSKLEFVGQYGDHKFYR